MSEPITGSQALVFGALDSGISFAAGVPGYPITGIMKLVLRPQAGVHLSQSSM